MKELKRVLIMAGGTGGHVFPGLAVAHALREKGIEVHWLGTSQGLEARLVPEAGIPLHLITISGLRGKGIKPLLMAPAKISTAILQSKRIIQQIQPDIVIGMGGFVSGPGGVASWLRRCPLIIHEQNAKAGLTNKLLSSLAKKVLEGFPGAFASKPKVIAIGNPVRSNIEHLPSPHTRLDPSRSPFRLLILGGSLGAQALNEIVPQALAQLPPDERPEILHQTGNKNFEATQKRYESLGIQATLTPFIDDMAKAYAFADMVLCRAGALTVAELCAVGLGAILVPFPHAVDDHQTANAQFMVKQHAALCIQQSALTPDRLADIVRQFSKAPAERIAMAQAAYQLRQGQVAERIVEICREVCR
ncbi:MAG: undecaprenyldiphospho-muramoylpentapeptide beta-N-acetylglucosaminyltransferase [Gammaproteobacteria bacterium]|nr:MAG: undecaprenyldiphospho-muramoylpentapeptide beta-N-acetylglucosaminyltransferase [Gammaproteobacteria bacterium]